MANRALIFEDNPINSKLMTMFLEQSGYYVELALSVNELNQKIAEGFDIVFIDTASPAFDSDSIETFIGRSKTNPTYKTPPLVAVMNTTKDTEIKRFLNMGMDGYIIKPISVKTLRETIDRVRSGLSTPAPGEDVVDIDKLSKTLGIPDKSLLLSLFDKFFTQAEKELRQMHAAAILKDYDSIRTLAHSFKGSSRNLRLTNLGKIAEGIESATKYPSATQDLKPIVNNLESATVRVFNDYCSRYQKKGDKNQ